MTDPERESSPMRVPPTLSHFVHSLTALLVLLAWEECSHEEIARVLDIPTGTVRSRLHRIRRELRSAMSGTADERPSQLQEEGTTHG